MPTVLFVVRFTESSTLNVTTPSPWSIFAPATRPTSTPASFTESPLNTPLASVNCAWTV